MSIFSAGDYPAAQQSLERAYQIAAQAVAEHAQRLRLEKQRAQQAFERNQVPEAEKAIQQALLLSPTDAGMLALQKRVGVLSQINDLMRQADVARSENRPQKEAAVLEQVLLLDPERGSARSRLQALRAELKQRQLAGLLTRARDALDAGDLTAAKAHIESASALSPNNTSLAGLQQRWRQLQLEQAFAAQMSLAEQAVQRDNWPAAAAYFERARQLQPHSEAAIEGRDTARKIVDARQKIDHALATEHRLGDKNIADSVAAYLREVEAVAQISPGLQQAYAELTNKLVLYTTEVEVVVLSDNATYIIVRGEGQVGKTLRRTIRLRPGRRVFEGVRPGYKSKLITVEIIPGELPPEVTIICDEKI